MAGLFTRHTKSTIFLLFYVFWWTFFFYWFTAGASAYPYSCGAANGALVILTFLFGVLYAFSALMLTIFSRGQKRKDFLVFFGLILFPVIYLMGYLFLSD